MLLQELDAIKRDCESLFSLVYVPEVEPDKTTLSVDNRVYQIEYELRKRGLALAGDNTTGFRVVGTQGGVRLIDAWHEGEYDAGDCLAALRVLPIRDAGRYVYKVLNAIRKGN